MINKTYLLTVTIVFTVGFIAGRQDATKINSVIQKDEVKINSTVVSQVQNTQENKKDSTIVKIISRKELYYSPNGKIKKVVVVDEQSKDKKIDNIFATVNKDTFKTEDVEQKSEKKIDYKSNWLLQVSHPITKINPTELNIGLGYSIINDIYLTASTDIKFSQQSLGVTFTF